MSVVINYEDRENLTIRLADDYFGLGYDELDDPYTDRGLKLGVSGTIELTLRPQAARELCQQLLEELLEGPPKTTY